jgi:peptidoglycan hydrolase-like protein with peptidoglycan-binding domain
MSGSPRDLAALDPWKASLERSRARRARTARGRARRDVQAAPSLSALLDARNSLRQPRDLADEEPWHLSLGRSRARRRAAELRFVPASSRAKRISLGALAAFTVGPTASIAAGQASSATKPPKPEPTTTTEHAIVLSSGSEGRQVRLLQQALGDVKVDGVFGPETEEAVRSFQSSRDLAVDGVVGPLTSAALREKTTAFAADFQSVIPGESSSQSTEGASRQSQESSPSPSSGASTAAVGLETSSPGSAAQSGESAAEEAAQERTTDAVKQLQSALHVTADGEFGPETEAAVMRLQARHGLAVDGIVGPQTWGAVGVHAQETLTPPPSAAPAAAGEGGEGSAAGGAGAVEAPGGGAAPTQDASAVAQLQNALHLPVDGEFGPETEAAVMRLQARHGLAVDGVVGPETWSVIGMQGHETLTPPPSAAPSPPATEAQGEEAAPAAEAPAAAQDAPAPEDAAEPQDDAPAPQEAVQPTQEAAPEPEEQAAPTPEEADSTSSAGEGDASSVVSRVIAAGNEIATRPYVYGGGHGSFDSEGYDCSGSVSYALHGAGLISAPEDSTQLESYGEAGPGKDITIYANSEHAYMVVDGKRFDTVALAEDGSRWSNSSGDDGGQFVARHPAGL